MALPLSSKHRHHERSLFLQRPGRQVMPKGGIREVAQRRPHLNRPLFGFLKYEILKNQCRPHMGIHMYAKCFVKLESPKAEPSIATSEMRPGS
jgi:hypothetical protein